MVIGFICGCPGVISDGAFYNYFYYIFSLLGIPTFIYLNEAMKRF